MKTKLMITFLGFLEEAYPSHYNVEKLRKRLKLPSLDGEFFKVVKYLRATNKIIVHFPETRIASTGREKLISWDEITITPEGIDFLSRMKSLDAEEKRNGAITKATVVLALAATIQAFIYFKQFSDGVVNAYDLLGLAVIGFMVIVIFGIAWDSFSDLSNFKKN
ncbi:hypothetical protein K8R30_00820 [archaeon]|nr:hypothetical protein [archaeon]